MQQDAALATQSSLPKAAAFFIKNSSFPCSFWTFQKLAPSCALHHVPKSLVFYSLMIDYESQLRKCSPSTVLMTMRTEKLRISRLKSNNKAIVQYIMVIEKTLRFPKMNVPFLFFNPIKSYWPKFGRLGWSDEKPERTFRNALQSAAPNGRIYATRCTIASGISDRFSFAIAWCWW